MEAVEVGWLQAEQQGSIVIAVRCQRRVQFCRQIGTESCHKVGSQVYWREILLGSCMDIADIATDIADIATDIADIVNNVL